MDDDDAAAMLTATPASPSPISDPVTVAVAVAASPPPNHILTLALPIQSPNPNPNLRSTPPFSGTGGGGREDAWSEGATSALIDAWGERFVALGRGSLRHPQWQEVADAVSSRDGYSKLPKSDVQCKNRIDTLKKKYKLEKTKPTSSWPFFHRLDVLLAPTYKPPNPNLTPPNPNNNSSSNRILSGVPLRAHFPQRHRTPLMPSVGKRSRVPSPPASPPSSESSDGFPPEPFVAANGKRRRPEDAGGDREGRAEGLRELAKAIRRLGETYERIEQSKLEQAAAMERQRMEFARDLEMQRVQFFMKTQMELSQVKSRRSRHHGSVSGGAGASSSNHRHQYNNQQQLLQQQQVQHRRHLLQQQHFQLQQQQHYQQQQQQYQNNVGGENGESEEEEEEEESQ